MSISNQALANEEAEPVPLTRSSYTKALGGRWS